MPPSLFCAPFHHRYLSRFTGRGERRNFHLRKVRGINSAPDREGFGYQSKGQVDCQGAGPRNGPSRGAGQRGPTARNSVDTAATTIEEINFLFYFGYSFLIGNVVAGSGVLIHDNPLRATTRSRCCERCGDGPLAMKRTPTQARSSSGPTPPQDANAFMSYGESFGRTFGK